MNIKGISGNATSGKFSIETLCLLLITCLMLSLDFNKELQWYSGFGIILLGLISVGIPHGAVDYLLETGKWNSQSSPLFILNYLLKGAAMGMAWYFIPQLAIIFFIGYSAWHFGQTDGVHWNFKSWESNLWGAWILLFILGTHGTETNDILSSMGNKIKFPDFPWYGMLPWLIYSAIKKNYNHLLTIFWISLTSQLPLIFAFGLYFIGQHSWISWNHIKIRLQLTHKNIWFKSLPFHAGGWLLLVLFLKFWSTRFDTHPSQMWGTFFIFVGCISFPHVISMNKMYIKMFQGIANQNT